MRKVYLHYSEKSVHWPEIHARKVKGPMKSNAGKKIKIVQQYQYLLICLIKVSQNISKIFPSQKNIILSQNTISSCQESCI